MNNILKTVDDRREFSYVKFHPIIDYIEELIDNDTDNMWAEYHHQVLDYMKNRFSRSFIVVDYYPKDPTADENSEIAAGRKFYNYLLATSDKYSKLIEFQEYKVKSLLNLRNEIDRTKTKFFFRDNIEDPTEDSTLRKFNETPLSGSNPNLLDDTYLSESERNTIAAGQRHSETEGTDNDSLSDIITDHVRDISAIPLIRENIRNYYLEWIKDIDRELFTYIPLDL